MGVLAGQVAIVTGGGRGIGRAMALALARAGAAVAVAARNESQLKEAVGAIEAEGGRGLAVTVDVTDNDDVSRMVETVQFILGDVDVLVNNAGALGPIGPVWEVDPIAWWHAVEVNVKGPMLCSQAVLPRMLERGRGRIINTSGDAALYAIPFASSYAVGKAAVTRLGENLAEELTDHGVAVFNLAPGFVRTTMTEDVANSTDDAEWLGGGFRRGLEEGSDHPPELAADLAVLLASGQADELSGCWIRITDDVDDLLRRRTDGDGNPDLRKLRLTR